MKRTETLIIFLSMIFCCWATEVNAQELVDSVVYRPAPVVDSLLAGKDIFAELDSDRFGAKVDIQQTEVVREALHRHIASNGSRDLSGYRVRIFFDNKQTARVESEEALKRFESLYHDVVAYRSYANPYFKVTVGDFRNKSEAYKLLERIRNEFPSAFVVKENIEFPVVDRNNAYVVDTVKVMRHVP